MNFYLPILMGGNPDSAGSAGIAQLGFFALLFVIMYMLLIRPQRKKQKEHEQLLKDLKKGDRVVTSSGMFGNIFAIDDDRNIVVLKVGEMKFEFLKSSIAARVDS